MSLSVALLTRRRDGRNNLVGPAELARWLGVTDKTVRELAKVGIAARAGRGLYQFEESVTRYCEHISRTASQRGGEASLAAMREERIASAKEQADALALKNTVARGEMLPAADVEAGWSAYAAQRPRRYAGSVEPSGGALATSLRMTSPRSTPTARGL